MSPNAISPLARSASTASSAPIAASACSATRPLQAGDTSHDQLSSVPNSDGISAGR